MHYKKKLLVLICVLIIFCCQIASQTIWENWFKRLTNSSEETTDVGDARKKKKNGKYVIPLLFAALLVKSIIFPLAFKAMAVMTSIAVLLSTMSLIMSSIVGYLKLVTPPKSVKIIKKQSSNSWAKDDENSNNNLYTVSTVTDYNSNISPQTEHYLLSQYKT